MQHEHPDIHYQNLLKDILENGVRKADRTGTGTYSVFGRTLRFDMRQGFPLLTTKKIYVRSCVHELLWMFTGSQNIKYLVDNDVSIWNDWPLKNYNTNREEGEHEMTMSEFVLRMKLDDEFAEKWGDLGPVYGSQWINWRSPEVLVNRSCDYWTTKTINQLQRAIDDLKKNPDSRRIMVSAWNPGEVDNMLLPSCHYAFQFWTRELTFDERTNLYEKKYNDIVWLTGLPKNSKRNNSIEEIKIILDDKNIPKRTISLMWQQRSCDSFLGIPFDIVLYGLLLSMVAQVVNMVPEELIFNGGDTHIYTNHVDQVKEQLSREPYPLCMLELNPEVKELFDFKFDDIKFADYKSHPAIKAPISV